MLGFGAVAGVALAHVVGYVVVVPGRVRRAELLAETGHGWHHIAALGGLAGALAITGAFWRGLRQRSAASRRPARSVPLLSDVRSVALVQMALFGAIETAERVLSHESVADLLHSRLLLVGLALQAVVACVVVTVLRAAEHAAARLPVGQPLLACSPSQCLGGPAAVVLPLAATACPDCRGPPFRSLRCRT